MKQCNKCNIELQQFNPTSGRYYICGKCNDVSYPNEEIDKVVERGRD